MGLLTTWFVSNEPSATGLRSPVSSSTKRTSDLCGVDLACTKSINVPAAPIDDDKLRETRRTNVMEHRWNPRNNCAKVTCLSTQNSKEVFFFRHQNLKG